MDEGQRRKAEALLQVVVAMPSEERRMFLETVCPEDTTLRREVERLAAETTLASQDATVFPAAATTVGLGSPGALSELSIGSRIGPYTVRRKLGEGGMGIVFEAEQQRPIRRTVALKVIKPGMDSAQVLARFNVERQALALMDHPGIAKVLDAGATERGLPYFVMEYVAGRPVTDWCDAHQCRTQERLALFAEICDAVNHAHQKGVVHRDLKPSNVLIHEREGQPPAVKVIDFGIARAVDQHLTEMEVFTQLGTVVGTPEYMSPEQARGESRDVDTRTDVYSLGVLLYELLVGRLPFEGEELRFAGFEAMRRMILDRDPPKPSSRLDASDARTTEVVRRRHTTSGGLLREVRGDLDWIVMRALEKDRERRYPSASELAAEVRRFLRNEPVSAGPPSAAYRARKFVRRHRLGVGFAAAMLLLLVAGGTASTIGFVRAVRAERVARFEADTSAEVIDFLVGLFRISDPGEARGNAVTAREILDRGVDSIQEELTDRPRLRGRLTEVMGLVYRSLGLYAIAAPLLDAAIQDQERAYGANSPELARSLSAKAGLLLHLRQPAEARPLLLRALEIQDATLSPNDPGRARTLNNLGLVARLEDHPEEALDYFHRALALRETALGPDAPEVIQLLSNIGSVERSLGREADAVATYERALAAAERTLPPDHPDRAQLLNNLGNLHLKAGRHDAARPLLDAALLLRERVLGPDHPDLVSNLLNLADACTGLGENETASALRTRAWAIAQGHLKPDDPRYLRAAESVGAG